jgi:hypothetical protein
LIGSARDDDSVERDIKRLMKYKYIRGMLMYYSVSLWKAQGFLLRVWRILHDVVQHDAIPMLEIPFTSSQLAYKAEDTEQ